jgi:hypothetical protein
MKQAGLLIVITMGTMALPAVEAVAQLPLTTASGLGGSASFYGVVAQPSFPGVVVQPPTLQGVAAVPPPAFGVVAIPPPTLGVVATFGVVAVPPPAFGVVAAPPPTFHGVVVRPQIPVLGNQ